MATKQVWTLNPEMYADLMGNNSAEDILSPTIRYPLVTDRHTPVFKQGKPQFATTEHPNSDHQAFLTWLKIENHKRTHKDRKGGPIAPFAATDPEAAELFMTQHPVYRTKRGLRHRLKTA